MLERKASPLSKQQVLALRGLRLPAMVLKRLRRSGIYCDPSISVVHQHVSQRYLLRGVEAGGAVPQIGLYSGYVAIDGSPLEWLQRIDSIGANGIHAIVVAPEFARIHMFRVEYTYELLITRHRLNTADGKQRPALESASIFHGVHGRLALELWSKDSRFVDLVVPVFRTKGGEPVEIPNQFLRAVRHACSAVCCLGCHAPHLLEAPRNQL
jgi:hypothetical protein